MELNENSTIKQLIESKKTLKSLRTIVSRRDVTIREVFNSVGYFYDSKKKAWLREDNAKSDEIPFKQALDELKGAQKPSPNRATNIKLMDMPNADLMSTNEKLIETNALNVLGMTLEEVQVLKQLIYERMNNESPDDIYTAISKLGGRNRKNKTFYISEDITGNVQEFCDNRGIKLSSFVEIAMIEAMMKYK